VRSLALRASSPPMPTARAIAICVGRFMDEACIARMTFDTNRESAVHFFCS
jgi:hypothetical protein